MPGTYPTGCRSAVVHVSACAGSRVARQRVKHRGDARERHQQRERAVKKFTREVRLVVALRADLLHHPPVDAIPLVDFPFG